MQKNNFFIICFFYLFCNFSCEIGGTQSHTKSVNKDTVSPSGQDSIFDMLSKDNKLKPFSVDSFSVYNGTDERSKEKYKRIFLSVSKDTLMYQAKIVGESCSDAKFFLNGQFFNKVDIDSNVHNLCDIVFESDSTFEYFNSDSVSIRLLKGYSSFNSAQGKFSDIAYMFLIVKRNKQSYLKCFTFYDPLHFKKNHLYIKDNGQTKKFIWLDLYTNFSSYQESLGAINHFTITPLLLNISNLKFENLISENGKKIENTIEVKNTLNGVEFFNLKSIKIN